VSGCSVLCVRKCGWNLCVMGEEVWPEVVCRGIGSLVVYCFLWVRKCDWILCAVGEEL